jgi:hypothetical protein
MAKDKERATAKALFLQGKSQKDIAGIVKTQEKTINNWCRRYGWKQQLEAKLNGNKSRSENIKRLIGVFTEERLGLVEKISEAENASDTEALAKHTKRANQIANEVAMYSKALESLDEDKKIPLTVYLDVMDRIFKDLQKQHPRLYMELVDFQENHINAIALKY